MTFHLLNLSWDCGLSLQKEMIKSFCLNSSVLQSISIAINNFSIRFASYSKRRSALFSLRRQFECSMQSDVSRTNYQTSRYALQATRNDIFSTTKKPSLRTAFIILSDLIILLLPAQHRRSAMHLAELRLLPLFLRSPLPAESIR